jgi:hypothetical protein
MRYIILETTLPALALAVFGYGSHCTAQTERSEPPLIASVTGAHVYTVELRDQRRKDRLGNNDVFLLRAPVDERVTVPQEEFHVDHLLFRKRFLPWHLADGCVWISEGQNGEGIWLGTQGKRLPCADLEYYQPEHHGDFARWEKMARKKYGAHYKYADHLNLSAPVMDSINRARKPENDLALPPTGSCYFDAISLDSKRIQCVSLTGSQFLYWKGECVGPKEAPCVDIKWKQYGGEVKTTFQEPFVLFTCKSNLAMVTEAGKAYRIILPSRDSAARIEPLWDWQEEP